MSAARRQYLVDAGVVLPGLLIAWLAYFGPLLAGGDAVPGDLGDARFNIYVLEHGFRWLRGEEPSLLSPGMMWPYPLTLAFSDTHAGTAWVYALLRAGGLDAYQSFSAWVVLGYFASYAAAYHVGRKFGLAPVVAGAFAFAFAFSLPAMVQIGHAQLAWRVAVPYCFWFALRFAEDGAPRHLLAFVIAVAVQTLINVYLGVFAAMLCALLFAACFIAEDGLAPRSWWRRLRGMAGSLRRLSGADRLWAGLAAIAIVGLAVVMGFHAYVAALYGLGRGWAETGMMVPRPQSYLMMDALPYWQPVSRSFADVPVRGEHQIFLGVPLTLLGVAALVYVVVRWRVVDARLRALALSILAALLLFTAIDGYSLFWLAAHLPGVNAIRAVARYMTVLAFPVAILAGLFVSTLGARATAGWLSPAAALVLVGWMALDLAVFDRYVFSSTESRQRVARLIAETPPGAEPVAYSVLPDDWWILQATDAILASQEMGRPTLKGYSGSLPPGVPYDRFLCQDAQAMLAMYDGWARQRGYPPVAALPKAVAVNMGPCDLAVAGGEPSYTRGRPIKRGEAPLIRLSDLRLAEDVMPLATVRIANGTDRVIHAESKHPFRLSWRVDPTAGWDSRVAIGPDLGPGQSRDVSFLVPAGTRLEDISVSFVAEGDYWAHDVGVEPLVGGR